MYLVNQATSSLLGIPTITSFFSVACFVFMGILALCALMISCRNSASQARIDSSFFWVFGFVLVAFACFRPIGIARDDLSYLDTIKVLCATSGCTQGMPVVRDYAWNYLAKFGLSYHPGSLRVILLLSGLGVLIKLFVIDRLCNQRLLALLLFVPLCYVQYDLTQLRAGLAIAWMMLGIYWLVRSKVFLGCLTLFTNFTFHSQAIFSSGLLIYPLFRRNRWFLTVALLVLVGLIYAGFYPSALILAWLGIVPETAPYFSAMQAGGYAGVKVFPWVYLLILIYGAWLCAAVPMQSQTIAKIASAGLLLGTLLAWFFAIIPTMQTRLFEFYAIPLTLLAGNVGTSRRKILATALLACVLYLRLEILNDWILG